MVAGVSGVKASLGLGRCAGVGADMCDVSVGDMFGGGSSSCSCCLSTSIDGSGRAFRRNGLGDRHQFDIGWEVVDEGELASFSFSWRGEGCVLKSRGWATIRVVSSLDYEVMELGLTRADSASFTRWFSCWGAPCCQTSIGVGFFICRIVSLYPRKKASKIFSPENCNPSGFVLYFSGLRSII